MKISLNWLRQFIELNESPKEIGQVLTQTGLEVEGMEAFSSIPGGLEGLVIGEVLTCEQHPNADKLKVTTVDIGQEESVQIICGAPNVAAGQKVIVATIGATLHPVEGEPFTIKRAKIRGESSQGMICAQDEIGLGSDHSGIMVLDTTLPNGTPAKEYLNIEEDHVYEIGLTPNRADAASHYGVARDLRAAFLRPLQYPDLSAFQPDNHDLPIEVIVEDQEGSPRFSGVTLTGLSVKESPAWLKNRLQAIGLAPINNVVDVTNYVLHSLGQPLHAYDADQITGDKIVVKTMPEGSTFITLDEKERKLAPNDLMVCNAEEGMCIGGVFGGIKSGVKESTTSIFLEGAYFSPDYIRKTASFHGLKTDASFRFERGTDPNGTVNAVKWAALLIKEVAGGKISSPLYDVGQQEFPPFKPLVRYRNIDRLIGKQIGHARIQEILTHLDIGMEQETDEGFTAVVPPYRVDVQREADVVEEILRIYGYDNVEISEHNNADSLSSFPKIDPDRTYEKVAELMAANGYFEIITNSLTKPVYAASIDSIDASQDVAIFNKLSEDLGVMRQSLLPGGLEVLAHNINRRIEHIKCYELGKIYRQVEGRYQEFSGLSLLITGNAHNESWRVTPKPADFYDLANMVYMLLDRLRIEGYDSEPFNDPVFEYGLSLMDNGIQIGRLGKIRKEIGALVGVSQEVFQAHLEWDALLKSTKEEIVYKEVPKYPVVKRDLSLVLDKSIPFHEVRQVALSAERKLLKKMNVFSVYEGKNIEENKKSYAISFILQDENKTLEDKQIERTMNRLMVAFEKEIGATIRK